MIPFFEFYFLLLLFGSLVITGWFVITRGAEQTLADGTKKKHGKLFKGWQFFWELKKKQKHKIYYLNAELYKKFQDIKRDAIGLGYKGVLTITPTTIIADRSISQYIILIQYSTEVKFEQETEDKRIVLKPFSEEDRYVFPEWLRDMMASCITCHASLYGSIIFWTTLYLFKYPLFDWATNQTIAMIFTWASYCFSLAYLNTFLYIKMNRS